MHPVEPGKHTPGQSALFASYTNGGSFGLRIDDAAAAKIKETQLPGPSDSATSDRYSRQILFRGIGEQGQKRLAQARVAVVGVGATGAASASLLARAGVGSLLLIDRDFVESSNLQRQILFDEADAAEALPKAEAARRKITSFNSGISIGTAIADLTPANIDTLLAGTHLILDCTDNFETRFLLNDFAVRDGVPWVYAAALGGYAATMNILPRPARGAPEPAYAPTACLACLFPRPPAGAVETCDTAGILSTAVTLAASLQTTEALKLLTGQPERMRRTLFSYDVWSNVRGEVSATVPDPSCAVCGGREFTFLAGKSRPHITLCGRNSVQIHEHDRPVDLRELQTRLTRQPEITDVRANALLLRFTRGPQTLTIFPDGRALVQGTTDPALARSLYARFLGN